MRIETDGLILRVQSIGDSDRLCTILTKTNGIIRAFARGANGIKSKNASSTGLFTFGKFQIFKRKDTYIIDDAEIKEMFYPLRENLEKLSLAQYFCEITLELCQPENKDEESLRLFLNSLDFLAKSKLPDAQIKAIFETRMMEIHGFMPNLIMCEGCGCFESEKMILLTKKGYVRCLKCGNPDFEPEVLLDISALTAMRHLIYSEFSKIFSFKIFNESLQILADASEKYLLSQTSRNFQTLDFYKDIKM